MANKTRFVILGLLRDSDLTGYDIKKRINTQMRFFWRESFGQIYPELNRLVTDDLICKLESCDRKLTKTEPIRYHITDKGLSSLKEWMESENEKDSVRSELLLKCFLSYDDNKAELVNNLEKYKAQCEEQIILYNRSYDLLFKDRDLHQNHKYILEVISLGIQQQKVNSAWCQQFLDSLKRGDTECLDFHGEA